MPAVIINILGPIIAQMGLMLLSERVVRRVTVATLRALEKRVSNELTKDIVDTVADALEVPPPVSK